MKFVDQNDIASRIYEDLRLAKETSEHELAMAMLMRGLWLWTPCTRTTAISKTLKAIKSFDHRQIEREDVDGALDELISSGTIAELQSKHLYDGQIIPTLYVKPPSYVVTEAGKLAITGFGLGSREQIPSALTEFSNLTNHLVIVPTDRADEIRKKLELSGISETNLTAWIDQPKYMDPNARLDKISIQARAAKPVKVIDELKFIDPKSDVTYYPGRWVTEATNDMRSIGRRPKTYGAYLWCYLEFSDNHFSFVDLPSTLEFVEARDEAWLLQLAIDSTNDNKQKIKVEEINNSKVRLDVFSPIPGWVERRWSLFGVKCKPANALFGYEFGTELGLNEAEFAEQELYLDVL